ncbi:MAG TPA: type II 3-dehydroquinate dehydratase [Solirubrobacteraceae bacterium]|jgi:3-dehydroquinate dehydratase-2|nr:type II 3-dehydroquinate dehydratase [Solirubrobacteraceae bacterium]
MRSVLSRVEVMHGVNLDQLGRRDPAHYGSLDLPALEREIDTWASEIGMSVRFFQSNHEGDFVEHLHSLPGVSDAIILNPGAWTHYAYAIHDALEFTGLPAVEVHLSAVDQREQWRQVSVIRDVCLATVSGKGPEGYREALDLLKKELAA